MREIHNFDKKILSEKCSENALPRLWKHKMFWAAAEPRGFWGMPPFSENQTITFNNQLGEVIPRQFQPIKCDVR
jgi:hypothetical protein